MQSVLALFCLAWWLLAFAVVRNLRNARRLADLPPGPRDDWPSVTTVMPACNEADTLDAAVRTRLADDYPDQQLILVNDRSTDGTRAVADAIDDPRLRVLHNQTLPEGWLGKVHALKLGVEASDSTWILFSDVDVHVATGALRRAVHLAESQGFDLVAALPTIRPAGSWMNGMHALFLRVLYAAFDPVACENPASKTAFGVGAFTLVRRSALDASPGFDAFRMAIADDLMLGRTLKASGARCTALNGAGAVSVDLYPRPADFLKGSEKNAWGVTAGFSLLRGLATTLAFALLEFSPFVLAVWGPTPGLRGLGVASIAVAIGLSRFVLLANGRRGGAGLLFPLGSLLFTWAMLRGTVLGFLRGGLWWRGTFYPSSAFRDARRA